MSNDGNKSTKRAPFTMFSSSAGGGYLDSFHTNFSGGVEINNLHTDVYGNYRNPPAQGPFNDDLVGGLAYRHQDVGSTSDRQEGFLISAQTGSIAITQTGRVQVYRDEYAKRPVNIRNIKDSSLGNYDMEYEVVQIAGRTLNPRHFVEFPEQYTTDYPLHKGTENPVFNVLDTDGNPETGSLSNYTLPDLTSSTDNFVFVNKFSSPGDRYTMSRGFLNPKGEEFSAYNASPFRNLSVRAELSEDLSRHTPKAENIPPEENTKYHTTNRNPVESTAFGSQVIYKDSSEWTHTVAFDDVNRKVYWVTDDSGTGNNIIKRANIDGTNVEDLASLTHTVNKLVIDPKEGYLFWTTTTGTGTIYRSDLDTNFQTIITTAKDSTALAIDTEAKKLYYAKFSSPDDGIYQINYDATGETILSGYTSQAIQAIGINSVTKEIYWGTIFSSTQIKKAKVSGTTLTDIETFLTETSAVPRDIAVEQTGEKEVVYFTRYYNSNGINRVANGVVERLTDITDNTRTFLALDSKSRSLFWTPREKGELYYSPLQVFDNGLLTHAIPRTDIQYTWIDSAALSRPYEFYGNQTGSSEISFYSNSVGFDSPMNNVYVDPVNATQSFDFTGSVYTYGTWKEIRGGELGLSRYYRNHNILPVTNDEDDTAQYIEPPVVAKHQPLDYNLAIDNTLTPYSVKSPYGNTLMRYSNDDINKLYDFRVSDKNTEYAKIKDLYLNKSIADLDNPVKAFYSLTYGEAVYPQSKNAFTNKVRVRGNYTEVAGTGSNGYDRLYGTQNTFYSTTKQRTQGSLNSQGVAPSTQAYTNTTYDQSFTSSTAWDDYSSLISRDSNSGIVTDTLSGSNCFVFGGQGQNENKSRYLMFKEPVIGPVTMSFSALAGVYGPLSMKGKSKALPSSDPYLYVAAISASNAPATDLFSWSPVQFNGITQYWPLTTPPSSSWEDVSFKAHLSESEGPMYIALVQDGTTFVSHDDNNAAIKDLRISYTPVSSSQNFDAFQPMKSSQENSFSLLNTFDKNVGELNSDTDRTLFEQDFQTSLSFTEENSNRINKMPGTFLSSEYGWQASLGYNERLSEVISGKTPSADSYEDYAANEKVLLKEASIIPEFRMSEHIPYYVKENAGNFREENKKFLTLLGSEQSSSADSYVSKTFNKEFEDTHLLTTDVQNIKKIRNDHIGHSKLSKLSIRAKGVKKLLPYNGFYPETRTVQIANELSESLSSNIDTYLYDSASFDAGTEQPSSNSQGYFGFLKTMASPGILYNSIKAGIAVDYPAFSTPPQLQTPSGEENFGDQQLLSAPDIRLPFDTLYNLEEGCPKDTKIYPVFSGDKLTEKKDVQPYSFSWDGAKSPSYELAMHNFLAESVKFFLKGEQLNSFISGPEKSFLEVEQNKKYYMDVVLDDQLHNNKFFNLKGEKNRFPYFATGLTSSAPINYDYGFDVDIVADHDGGCYMITGIPGNDEAPGLGDSGKIKLHYIDANGSVEMLYSDKPATVGLNDRFGESVTICSGSTGIYFGASAPDNGTGKVFYYKHVPGGATTELTDSTTVTATVTKFGAKIKSLYDEVDSKVYFAILDATNSNGTDSIGIHLRSVATAGTTVAKDGETFFDKADAGTIDGGISPRDYLGLDLLKTDYSVSANDRLHIAVSSQKYQNGSDKGAVLLKLWNGAAFSDPSTAGPYLDVIDTTTLGYGSDISLVASYTNGSSYTEGYVAVGRGYLGSDTKQGTVALFHTDFDSGFRIASADVYNDTISTKGPAGGNGIKTWGTHVSLSIDSSTKDLVLAASNHYFAEILNGNLLGSVELQNFSHKFDALGGIARNFPTGTLKDYIIPEFDNKVFMNPQFGSSMAVDLKSDSLYIGAGSPKYSGSLSAGGISHLLYGTASYHDYRQDGKLFGFAIDGNYDPSYCAYTHPGYYGESVARISFSSSIGGPVTLEEIFMNSEVEDISTISSDRTKITTGSFDSSLTAMQETAKMPFSASIALFERVQNPGMEFSVSEDGTISSADRAVPSTKDAVRWAISTRYESPVVDISSSLYSANYSTYNNRVTGTFPDLNDGTTSFDTPQTIWTSYSPDRNSTKKYNFTLRESSFSTPITSDTGSLIQLCGFTPGTKNVGSVADTKQISEAIMVVPYTDRAISKKTVEIEKGKHFFRLNQSELKRQKKSTEDNGYAVSEEIPTTSISQMLSGMKEYVIPPAYNFLAYKDIKPFVAYFLEFEHTLNNEDLTSIWQGLSPSIALNPELDEVEISHDIDKHNFFHNIDVPNDIKFMVFKVKKKAEWNYYNITTDSTDDDRFRFDFQGNGQVEVIPEYSYNWPYDFFSLVERAEVAVDFTLKKPEEDE